MKITKLYENVTTLPGNNGGAYSASRRFYQSTKYDPAKTIESYLPLSEEIVETAKEWEKGGYIVLSTDVNALDVSDNKVINWFKKKFETLKNRINATKMIDKVAQNHKLVGWSIGHYINGRYTASNGKSFGENSLSILIVGVTTDDLIEIAEDLCREFQQETVMVEDFTTGNIYFVNGK